MNPATRTGSRAFVMIHQPHLLPWPPYIGRLLLSDYFVPLDDVPFRKNYYQNRTRLLAPDFTPFWLTLPVSRTKGIIRHTFLNQHVKPSVNKWRTTFRQFYGKSRGWSAVWPPLERFISALQDGEFTTIYEASYASIHLLFRLLELKLPTIRASSEFRESDDRTRHLITCTLGVSADSILLGWGKSSTETVHNLGRVRRAGIRVGRLNRARAVQIEPRFLAHEGVSTLHWLLELGPQEVADKLTLYEQAVDYD